MATTTVTRPTTVRRGDLVIVVRRIMIPISDGSIGFSGCREYVVGKVTNVSQGRVATFLPAGSAERVLVENLPDVERVLFASAAEFDVAGVLAECGASFDEYAEVEDVLRRHTNLTL